MNKLALILDKLGCGSEIKINFLCHLFCIFIKCSRSQKLEQAQFFARLIAFLLALH